MAAQDRATDSLKILLQQTKHDTSRCAILNAIVDNCSDDNVWPAYNTQMKQIAENRLKTVSQNDPSFRIYQKFLSIALSNLGYLEQMKGELSKALDHYLQSLGIQEKLGYKLGVTTNLNNIASIYKSRGELVKALERYKENLKVQEELNDKEGIAVSLNNIGAIYRDRGDIPNALDHYNKSLNIRKEIKDNKGIANSLNNMALLYQSFGDIDKALDLHYESLKMWEEANNKSGISTSLNNIGLLFSSQKDYDKALEYYTKSASVDKETGDKFSLAFSLNNIGYIYTRKNDTKKALDYYQQSLELRKKLEDWNGIAVTLNNIGTVYEDEKDYGKALGYYTQSLKIREEIGHKEGIAYSLNSMAHLLFKQGQNSEALGYAKRGLNVSQELGYPDNIRNAGLLLSRIYAAKGDYKAAYDMYVLFHRMDDSVKNEINRKSLLKKEFQYKYEKKDNEVKLLKQQAELDLLKLNEQQNAIKWQRYLLVFSLLAILLVLISVYYYFSKQKMARLIEKEHAVRQTEEKERQRIAKDIHDELGSGLSKIKFLSELANVEKGKGLQQKHLDSISHTAAELVENMRDLVWAMNPENTSLDNLVARIREYSHDYLDEFPFEFRVDIPETIPPLKISKEVYRNVFMIVKEILQNIIKHASANEVFLKIAVNGAFSLEIKDNGTGFNAEKTSAGNGLKNIVNRSKLIGGEIQIESKPGEGSVIKFRLETERMNNNYH